MGIEAEIESPRFYQESEALNSIPEESHIRGRFIYGVVNWFMDTLGPFYLFTFFGLWVVMTLSTALPQGGEGSQFFFRSSFEARPVYVRCRF